MFKILLAVVFLVATASLSLAGGAAPYTDEALKAINKAIQDTPKEKYTKIITDNGLHKGLVQYYTLIFDKAGYGFTATIDKIVADMKNNPKAIPRDRETVYNKIYVVLNIMMAECESQNVDCLKFYPPETQQSIQWFMQNNDFNKKDKDNHVGGKPKS
jgi:hypothetical protein